MGTLLPSVLAAGSQPLMDPALATLLVLFCALILFATEWLRADVTAMCVVMALYFLGVLTWNEATSGLGNQVVITIAAMFVVGHAVLKTGAATRLERAVLAMGGRSEGTIIAVSFMAVAAVSAWVQNIAGMVLVLPAIIGVARQRGLSASRLLMPLAAASLTGGLCTLVGSPASLALDARLREMGEVIPAADLAARGLQPLTMFETTGLGLALVGVSVLYFSLMGPRLLPAHRKEESLSETYEVKQFLSEVLLKPGSDLVGRKLVEAQIPERYGVVVLGIVRGGKVLEAPDPWTLLHADDVLLVQGKSDPILKMRRDHVLDLVPRVEIGDRTLRSGDLVLAEMMLSPNSRLVNRSLGELNLPEDYGMNVLAVARHGESLRSELGEVRLRIGDVVLVQGHVEGVERFRRSPDWMVLDEDKRQPGDRSKAFLSAGIMLSVIGLATLTPLPLAFAAMLGVVALVVFRVLRRREIYEAVEWPVVILIAGVLPLGTALEKTGLATAAASWLGETIGPWGPLAALSVMYLTGTLLTGFLNNAALTIMLAPVAIQLSEQLAISPRPLLIACAAGATADFLTPVGQSNALVMGPGQYSFRDYLRVGVPLTLLCFVVAILVIPAIWPFRP